MLIRFLSFFLNFYLGQGALSLMQSSAFSLTNIGSDYVHFKRNFLKVFGDSERESLVKQVSHAVDILQSNAASCPILDGLVGTNQLANDCVKSLEESQWLVEGKLSKDNRKKFLKFLFYVSCFRKDALSRPKLIL